MTFSQKDQSDSLALNALRLDSQRALHLVGHLEQLSFFCRLRLYFAGYDKLAIAKELQRPGSRFLPDFARSPNELLKRIAHQAEKQGLTISWEGNTSHMRIRFREEEFPMGIGHDGIVSIAHLEAGTAETLTKRKISNSSFLVNVVVMDTLPPTWWANIILRKARARVSVTTIFPGTDAPPFPDPSFQSAEKYKTAQQFWNTHALVDSRKSKS